MSDSDKLKGGLFEVYGRLFVGLRHEPIKYLEVGVAEGGSLAWAREFFAPDSQIFGIDKKLPPKFDGVVMHRIDQRNSNAMRRFGNQYGPFDIIIDDGSHVEKLTRNTFDSLFPFLKLGGFYIIEDWAAGYLPQYQGTHTLTLNLVHENGGAICMRPEMGGCFAIIGETSWKIYGADHAS